MAKKTGDGYRKGEVRERSQVYNPTAEKWVKRDSETGRFMNVKEDGEPYKSVRKED
jgi:transposase